MDAREALGASETAEIADVLVHPRAEALPKRARLGLGQGGAVDENAKRHGLRENSYTSPGPSCAAPENCVLLRPCPK